LRALPITPGWPCADREASSATWTVAPLGAASPPDDVAEVASDPGALLAQPTSRKAEADSTRRLSPPWPTEAPADTSAPLIACHLAPVDAVESLASKAEPASPCNKKRGMGWRFGG